MDGIHDLGGKHGFGRVEVERDEPVFHHDWEARAFAIVRASIEFGARSNVDQFRHAIERIDPAAYLTHTYYGRWIGGIENLLVESGLLTRAEIDARYLARGGGADDLIAARPAANPDRITDEPTSDAMRPLERAARFKVGDWVVTHRHPVAGHTRLPAYARGRTGRVVAVHGGWIYPDSNAHGHGEDPQHLYTVAFDGEELWGGAAEPAVVVHLDLFEPYLEGVDP